ncbi:hypothetical protein ACIRQP_32590 [Streptomyces sp. NPDC102274]|uniref:hypothetical protein n=1 Tax=Streptomyces sp. NPDC102274 TaxID=3366151 RepID=UPI0038165624
MGSEALSSGGCRVRDLVREVIADLAPDELPLLDGLFNLDDATAIRRLTGRGQRREPLGFGMGEIAVLITPVVWLTLDQAARRIADAALDSASRESTALLRRLFRRRQAPVTMPPLTREQLVEVRRLVLETAERRGLPAERASEVADGVVAGLALAEPDTSDDGGPDTPAVSGTPQEN